MRKKIAIMKNIFFLLVALTLMPSIMRGDTVVPQTVVTLQYDRDFTTSGRKPRVPSAPIYAYQSANVFTFEQYLSGNTIEFLSGETIVYTSIIPTDGIVVIPDDIVGEYKLLLYVGNASYSADVELYCQ